jgi:hypothetical protein
LRKKGEPLSHRVDQAWFGSDESIKGSAFFDQSASCVPFSKPSKLLRNKFGLISRWYFGLPFPKSPTKVAIESRQFTVRAY